MDFKLSFNIHTEPEWVLFSSFFPPHKHCRTANSFNYTRVWAVSSERWAV